GARPARLSIGDEKQAAGGEADDARPLATAQWWERRFGESVGFAAVGADRLGHEAVDVAVLAAEADERAVAAEDERRVATRGPPAGVAPGLALVIRGEEDRRRAL